MIDEKKGIDDLTWELHDGGVGVITLNRPQARNALTWEMYAELERLAASAQADGVRCLVVTGTDPAFCSGDDVKLIMVGGAEGAAPIRPEGTAGARTPRLTPAAGALLKTDVPIVAAVNGAAVGWGMELAMMADIRVASPRAKFGELFVLRGLVTDVCGLGRLAQLVGREKAAELVFTGDIIDAQEAARIGLVSRVVVNHEELLPTALGIAGRIAANAPLAVQALKSGLRKALDPDWDDLGAWVAANLARLFQTEDHREGVRSFLEKRPATYVGR